MATSSDLISGSEAERMGLVSVCTPDDELLDKAIQVATKLATGPGDAMRFTKRALNQWLLRAAPIFDHSPALEMMGFFGKDLLAGVEDVPNKRPGRFHSDGYQHGAARL